MRKINALIFVAFMSLSGFAQTNIFPTIGHVGIGVLNPLNGLSLFGSANDIEGGSIRLGYSGAEDAVISFGWNGVNQDAFKIKKYPHQQNSNPVDLLTINANGNMGIGIANPLEKLAVKGKIRAIEIKVEAIDWPDYVFEEGYKIGTLQETGTICKN